MDYNDPNIQWVVRYLEERSGLTWSEILRDPRSPVIERALKTLGGEIDRIDPSKKSPEFFDKSHARFLVEVHLFNLDLERRTQTATRANLGRRTSLCRKCYGTGRVNCYLCDGVGSYMPSGSDFSVTCRVCNGRGTIACHECGGSGQA